jgi:hypothetical protein
MIMPQVPVPPTPPTPPAHSFDPNLVLLTGGPPLVIMIVVAALAASVIILWPIVRAFARRLEGKGGDPALRAEVEQLHARLGEVDTLQTRIVDLEERLDFAERLLAQNREPDRLQR